MKINPRGKVNAIFMFTPYPGTPLFDHVIKEYRFVPPQTLEEWSRFKIYLDTGATWYNLKHQRMLKTISVLTRFPFYTDKYEIPKAYDEWKYRHIYKICSYLARKRWKNRFFEYPIEWVIVEKLLLKWRDYV